MSRRNEWMCQEERGKNNTIKSEWMIQKEFMVASRRNWYQEGMNVSKKWMNDSRIDYDGIWKKLGLKKDWMNGLRQNEWMAEVEKKNASSRNELIYKGENEW